MTDTAEYALRLANGESLAVVLNEVWEAGVRSRMTGATSPYAPSVGVK